MQQRLSSILITVCLTVLLAGCASRPVNTISSEMTSQSLYTRYNVHYFSKGPDLGASCVNYVGSGMFLPYNTRCRIGSWDQGFTLKPEGKNMTIYFEYSSRYMAGMTLNDYLDLIMSRTPVRYSNLSEMDRQGIHAGEAKTWMTKQGIKVALGYPAKHRTPTLEKDTWIYWKNRIVTMAVHFDPSGKVVEIH